MEHEVSFQLALEAVDHGFTLSTAEAEALVEEIARLRSALLIFGFCVHMKKVKYDPCSLCGLDGTDVDAARRVTPDSADEGKK